MSISQVSNSSTVAITVRGNISGGLKEIKKTKNSGGETIFSTSKEAEEHRSLFFF